MGFSWREHWSGLPCLLLVFSLEACTYFLKTCTLKFPRGDSGSHFHLEPHVYLFREVNLSNFFAHVPLCFLLSFSRILIFSDIGPSVPLLLSFNFSSIFHHFTSRYTFGRTFSSFSSKLSVECFYFWYSVFRLPELSHPQAVAFLLCVFLFHNSSTCSYLPEDSDVCPCSFCHLCLLQFCFVFFLMCLCHFSVGGFPRMLGDPGLFDHVCGH